MLCKKLKLRCKINIHQWEHLFKKSIYSCIVTDVKQQKINMTILKLSELVTAAPLEHILSKRKKYDFIKQNELFWRTKTYGEHLALSCDCFTWQKPLRWTLKLLIKFCKN